MRISDLSSDVVSSDLLLEAIRWVMGENSPKSMRSGGMDDVIFAGTETRPARDFAEVVLHGRDHTGEELHVTRRIERGAGSAYRLNGRPEDRRAGNECDSTRRYRWSP